MAQWFVKDLSRLTHISVQTLHHYDRINLLKPSLRLDNGYRVYTEKDLSKLQQIIALKYFGFELKQIKSLLKSQTEVVLQLSHQSTLLQEKARALNEASEALKRILLDCSDERSPPWEKIIQLIEVYRMTQEIENKWATQILNSDELRAYAAFEKDLKTRFSDADKLTHEKQWAAIVERVKHNLNQDPSSPSSVALGKECMDWVNHLYGKKHAALRSAIWEKGFKPGKMGGEHALDPQIVDWLDKAMLAYYQGRIRDVVNQQDAISWGELLLEMCGDSESLRSEVLQKAMADSKISAKAKAWLGSRPTH